MSYAEKYPHGRCTAMRTPSNTGARCQRDSVEGTDRCDRHQHSRLASKTKHHMHRFYLRALRPTLLAALEQGVKESPIAEQLSLLGEVELSRHAASHSLEQYAEAVELAAKADSDQARKTAAMAVRMAAEMLKGDLAIVSARVKDAAAVENVKAAIVSNIQTAFGVVLTEVLRAAHDAFGDDHRVKEFERLLHERIEYAEQNHERLGTDLTPERLEEQVLEIDALSCPVDEVAESI